MEKLLRDDSFPVSAYRLINRIGIVVAPLVLLLMRFSWGIQLIESGYNHLTNVDVMVKQFIGFKVPMPLASVYVSAWTELAGGALLALGLGTRLVSIPLVFNFIVAIVAANRGEIADAFRTKGIEAGWDQIVDDTAFRYLILALVTLAFGPGIFSIDDLLGRKLFCKHDRSARKTPA